MVHNPDWIDTPPLEFAIRGLDGSVLRFVLESRLNPASREAKSPRRLLEPGFP
jgi:hypothetical protein